MTDRAYAQYDIEKKSLLVAYLLWFFLGYVGAHRFYLGRLLSGFVMLAFSAVTLLLTGCLVADRNCGRAVTGPALLMSDKAP